MAMFTATEKRNLTRLLASEANQVVTGQEEASQGEINQREVRTLDGLHGFLFGLAITPERVLSSEWLPVIFGESGPPIDDKKVGNRLLENLFLASDRIAKENQDGVLSFPFGDPIKSKEVQRIQDWTSGLYLAIGLRPELWAKRYTVNTKSSESYESVSEITSCFSVIMGISDPEKITEFIKRSQGSDSQLVKNAAEFLARLFVLLPKAILKIQKHANAIRDGLIVPSADRPVGPTEPLRVEKVGRNDPCPCGSGTKYKKCCGK
jgi:yecA family protein